MVLLSLVSMIWAFTFGLIKYNLTNLDANFVAFLRMAAAFPCFALFLRISNLSKKLILNYIALGAIQYGLMYVACIRAYSYLDAHQVVLFTAMTPIYVTIINGLYERKMSFISLLASFIAFLAIALIYYKQLITNSTLAIGIGFVQISDFCFAFGQVSYKKLRQYGPNLQDIDIFGLMFLGAMLVTSIATTISGGWVSLSQISLSQFLIILYLGSISSGLCFFLWNKGALLVNSGTLAIFNNLKIPLGVLVSIIAFRENASILKVSFSLFVILTCIVLQEAVINYRRQYITK